jgi:hypothetical protein
MDFEIFGGFDGAEFSDFSIVFLALLGLTFSGFSQGILNIFLALESTIYCVPNSFS